MVIPLGGRPQTPCLSHLAPCPSYKPSVYPAWWPPANPVFNPLDAHQILNLVWKESLPPLAGDGAPMKKCSHFFHGYPGRWPQAGRGNTKPAFIPLGGCPQTQHLSRLAARSVFFEFVEEVDGVTAAFAARAGARFHAEAFIDLVAGDEFGHAGEEVAFHADVDV